MSTPTRSNNFEKSLADLEKIVAQLEQGDLSLDEAMQAFEQGVRLTRDCQQQLDSAEQKVRILLDESQSSAAGGPAE
ncbi:exodeoxyribonuclease VII small subunit [Natronospirillum operosum]|uniref:Exodeoxyribonuclease 7 small subunit n=1 Tax=Natronospirillum operosum TaxID=2759953 RepID=A0A4Z0W1M5_9GAMM|nr:exodeoxyribonuclease VII small subunit [Natronospirillum operosum]TGG90370.1 exodeoxyribonuclease VII small subunit [Natronospirillum operosum]